MWKPHFSQLGSLTFFQPILNFLFFFSDLKFTEDEGEEEEESEASSSESESVSSKSSESRSEASFSSKHYKF